ncbi:MAG: hypothetical protein LBK63_07525 [Treponema sp.]|jgi:hypothetical protein|nr:hypothetical protein [Treponema sp.]
MKFLDEDIMNGFDMTVNRYLMFLVHAQKSSLIQVLKKIEIFNIAKTISAEIKANIQKTLSNVNEFNFEEKKLYIKKVLLHIEANMENEINNKQVKINADAMPLFNTVIDTLTTDANGVKLSLMDISNIFSYKELNSEKDKHTDKELQSMKDKLEVTLEELKNKAFITMLYRENKNPELYYKVNKFILNKCKTENIKLYVSTMPDENHGGLFFMINNNDLTIRRREKNGLINYTIKFTDIKEQFNINITGKILVNNSEDTFIIDETYPTSMRANVLNTYAIRQIIELFNLLYKRYITEDHKPKKSNDIDDYLSGKIKND